MNTKTEARIYRRKTNLVQMGNVILGGNEPVCIQSMANTPTSDIHASIEQCIRIIRSGADIVRLTVPSLPDVDAFAAIQSEIRKKGFTTPLVADVHFNPEIAFRVAAYADKVRINPGNFNDYDKFRLLVQQCKERGTAIRIGVNHGSLSERIMDRYGDTPEGMAESAMEFLRICREIQFDKVVVSMKSSNVRVMIYATRILTCKMKEEKMEFPLHLGVTEAGEGEDGRIKSAVGIGTLLCEGIGDTIRVSLTEDPECEIPVARKLLQFALLGVHTQGEGNTNCSQNPVAYERRKSRAVGNIGGGNVPVVFGVDDISTEGNLIYQTGIEITNDTLRKLLGNPHSILVYTPVEENIFAELVRLRNKLEQLKCDAPVIFKLHGADTNVEDFMIRSAISLGGAFIDGFGDGIWLTNQYAFEKDTLINTALGILQACRMRMSKTEFISCPSCGRTHFNLMDTLAQIKKETDHLKGLKIGVMGCIVNGPGEMADADYGYVGSAIGKVTLYKAKEVVKRNIPEAHAVQELISLIKSHGDWVEKP